MIQFVAYAMIVLCPITMGAAAYSWQIHARSRLNDTRVPKPKLRLSLILALTSTLGAVGSTVLAVVSYAYVLGYVDIVQRLGAATLLTFLLLDTITFINVGYLKYLDLTSRPKKGGATH